MTQENQIKYLNRIKYQGSLAPSIEALTNLQKSHLFNIPFENLDIIRGKKIELENTFEKVVNKGRGGFCYELNGLFFELLNNIGFSVHIISARPYSKTNGFGPEFDHMAIIALIDGVKYLVDVGFGEFALLPLKIELNRIQDDPRGKFVIEKYDDSYLIVKKKSEDGNFIPEYIFTEIPRELKEFQEMCTYHQTSSMSHFTQKRLCSLPMDNGRVTISGDVLKITENSHVTEIPLKNQEEYNNNLLNYFNIKL